MRTLISDATGKTVESVDYCSEGVAIHFTDGTSFALTARVSYESVDIEPADSTLDAYDARTLGLITAAEYDEKMNAQREAWTRSQEEREREQLARLLAKFGGTA